MTHDSEEPSARLARDEFTARRRDLDDHPEAVTASARIDVTGPFGDVSTWCIDLYRVDGAVTAFVQRGSNDGFVRLVIPPAVTAAIARHQSGLVTKARRKTARRVIADRLARGERVGNPEALQKARKARGKRR